MSTNSEKSRLLYAECNEDPKGKILTPVQFEKLKGKEADWSIFVGSLISEYAKNEYANDWIPFNKSLLKYIEKDKQNYKPMLNSLEEMGVLQTKTVSNQAFIKLIDVDLFNIDIYKTEG